MAASEDALSSADPPVGGSRRGGRKISLPWFRQSSFGLGGPSKRLAKQHTIAVVNDIVSVHCSSDAIKAIR